MTSYFDDLGTECHKIGLRLDDPAFNSFEALREIEERVVFDVTLCAEWPGCPPEVANAIHRIILRYGVSSQPTYVDGPDYETVEQHLRGLGQMFSALHDVFHELGSLRLENFSDHPKRPVWNLVSEGAEKRRMLCPVPVRQCRAQLADCLGEERAGILQCYAEHAFAYAKSRGLDDAAASVERDAILASITPNL